MPLLVDVRKLTVINDLIEDGAENVVGSLETLAGVDANVDIKTISFLQPDDIATEMGAGRLWGASVTLTESPYGVFLITFSEPTAAEMAGLLTNNAVEGEFNQMHRSALEESTNILASGFIDGIANTLQTTIDFTSPDLFREEAETIAAETLSHVRRDATSIVLDSVVDVEESNVAFKLRIFLVPDPGSFVHLIDQLELDSGGDDPSPAPREDVTELEMDTEADPEFVFDGE
ncbi:MAG: chemotaxis protein CheC [Haloarculaceae archaeon]